MRLMVHLKMRGIFFLFGLGLLPLLSNAATSYKINYNSSAIINEFSTCKVVTNTSPSGLALFVPTSSSTEWSAFYTNPSSGVTATTCLTLDLLSVSPTAAFSLRKLRVLYTGAAIRVRHGTNNAEADIAFDSSGVVSATSMATIKTVGASGWTLNQTMAFSTFYSGASVFVQTLYDQSGNSKDLSQATAANQPRIVNAGTIDANPSAKIGMNWYDSASRSLAGAAPMASGSELTVSLIKHETVRTSSTDFYLSGDSDPGGRILGHVPWSDGTIYFDTGTCCAAPQRLYGANPYGAGTTNIFTLTNSVSANTKVIYVNATSVATGGGAAATVNRNTLGSSYNGIIHEYLVFGSSLSTTDRQTLQGNQKAFWGTP